MNLSPLTEKFVLHWGEMGTRWGVSRTVAQIHALLYLSERALHAEEIADTLSVARSNVSTSLKELQGWGLVKVVHVMGDRRPPGARISLRHNCKSPTFCRMARVPPPPERA